MSKLLVIANPNYSVEYHRLVMPYLNLKNNSELEIDFIQDIDPRLNLESGESIIDIIQRYDYFIFNRFFHKGGWDASNLVYELIKEKAPNAKTVLDIDDMWHLPPNHVAYESYGKNRTSELIQWCIRRADIVTCTNPQLEHYLKIINPNVFIVNNGIDLKIQKQFIPEPTDNYGITRFGYLGGSTHFHDVSIMGQSISRLYKDKTLDFQLYLCGYFINPVFSATMQAFPKMEFVFANGYKGMSEQPSYSPDYQFPADSKYQRVLYNPDLGAYAGAYNLFEVALAPLENTLFNNCKSELKMIEGGFMRKTMIVSNMKPYLPLAKHNKNCLVVSDNRFGWYEAMKRLIKNPALAHDLAHELHEEVVANYDLNEINKTRLEIFQ